LPRPLASLMGIFLMAFTGYTKTTPITLNRKCTKAIVTAAGFPVAKEARIAVVVVPMFAPIVIGNMDSTVKSPAPVKGTKSDVVIELLI